MMVVMLSKFNRKAQACHEKFNQIFVSYKEDKLANGILGKKVNFMTL